MVINLLVEDTNYGYRCQFVEILLVNKCLKEYKLKLSVISLTLASSRIILVRTRKCSFFVIW